MRALGVDGVRYTFADMRTTNNGGARFRAASDQTLLVTFGQQEKKGRADALPLQTQNTLEVHECVRKLLRLMELQPVAGVRNLHPAYCSLLVKFDALKLRHEDLEKILHAYLQQLEKADLPEPRRVEIPV